MIGQSGTDIDRNAKHMLEWLSQARCKEDKEAGSKEAKKKRSRKQKGQKGKSSTKKQTEKKGDTSDTDENTSDFLERARRKRREILATSSEEDHVRE